MPNILETFEIKLSEFIKNKDFIYNDELLNFVFSPSKRLRPKLIFSILKSLKKNITNTHIDLMIAIELLHSATLIHDDIIDEDDIRRGQETFKYKFGNKKSVLLGDYLLFLTLSKISEISSTKLLEMYSKSIGKIINGELNQYNELGNITSEELYIERCELKTGELFILAANSVLLFSNASQSEKNNILNFAKNFGIAFQIKNDLENYINKKTDEKQNNYTLPYILSNKYHKDCDIIKLVNDKIIEYKINAKNSIENIKNKEELVNFLGYLE